MAECKAGMVAATYCRPSGPKPPRAFRKPRALSTRTQDWPPGRKAPAVANAAPGGMTVRSHEGHRSGCHAIWPWTGNKPHNDTSTAGRPYVAISHEACLAGQTTHREANAIYSRKKLRSDKKSSISNGRYAFDHICNPITSELTLMLLQAKQNG